MTDEDFVIACITRAEYKVVKDKDNKEEVVKEEIATDLQGHS